jgi:hypothetical protein
MASRKPIPADQAATTGPQTIATALERRDEAGALRAESRQALRHAQALLEASSAILDAAIAITGEILARRRIALVEPVGARFQTDEHGSSGIELTVKLEDPLQAGAVKQALIERFGGEAHSDSLIVA